MRRLFTLLALTAAVGCSSSPKAPANAGPQASFAGPVSVRRDVPATFDAAVSSDSDGQIVSWSFDFGDGSAPATGSPLATHAYAAPGAFTVTLTVADEDGATGVVSRDVTVTDNVPPIASLTGPSIGRINRTLVFDASGSSDADGSLATYSFDFGDQGTATGAAPTQSHTYLTAGTYTVTATVTDTDGATGTASFTIPVADNIAPSASFSGPASAIVGQLAAFDSSASSDADGSIASRSWSFGDATTSTVSAPQKSWSTPGLKTVTLTVTDDEGKTGTFSREVNVMTGAAANPAPVAAFTAPASARVGTLVPLDGSASSASGGTVTGHAWDFGDTTTGAGATVNKAWGAPGTYTASLVVTGTYSDGSTATGTASRSISITPNLAPSASLTGPATTRVNRNASFDATASADSDGTIVDYSFDFGDGTTSTGPSPVQIHAWSSAGTYLVQVTATDNDGATSTASRFVDVTPNAAPVASLTGPLTVRVNRPAVFDAAASADPDGTIATYGFDFGDGTPTVTTPQSSVPYTWSFPGTFTVTVLVTDDEGGTGTATRNIVVTPNESPIASLAMPAAVRVNRPAMLDGSGSADPDGSIVNYSFTFGDGGSAFGPQAAVPYTWTVPGTYTVTLTAIDDDGLGGSQSKVITVSPNQPPVAAFDAPATASVGQVVSFDASASSDPDSAITTRSWDFGDGTPGFGAAVNHAYASVGTYIVSFTVFDEEGASNVATRQVTVQNTPPAGELPPAAQLSVPSQVMLGEQVDVDGSGSSGGTGSLVDWAFDFGDGNSVNGTLSSRVKVWTNPGLYSVLLTVTTQYGDGSTATHTVGRQVSVVERYVQLAGVSPASGDRDGGYDILVFGGGFTTPADTTVTFGSTPAAAVTVIDSNTMRVGVPAGDPGVVDLSVANSNGAAVLPAAFTYLGGANQADTSFCPQLPGTVVGFVSGDDDRNVSSAATALPFPFTFFGTEYPAGTQLKVTPNGWASFLDTSATPLHEPIPSSGNPKDLLAPLFFDQYLQGTDDVYTGTFGSAPDRRFVLRWQVSSRATNERSHYTITLYEGSDDIKLQYVGGPRQSTDTGGSTALIGIQDASGTEGVEFSRNAFVTGVSSGRTVVFRKRNGAYSASTDTVLTYGASSLRSFSVIANDEPLDFRFSRPVNPSTVVAGSSVQLVDDASGANVPISSITFNAAKDTIYVSSRSLAEGRYYRLIITGGVRDHLDRPFTNTPMSQACGGGGTTNFEVLLQARISQVASVNLPTFASSWRDLEFESNGARAILAGATGIPMIDANTLSISTTLSSSGWTLGVAVAGSNRQIAYGRPGSVEAAHIGLPYGVSPYSGFTNFGFYAGPLTPYIDVAARADANRFWALTATRHVRAFDLTGGAFTPCDNSGGAPNGHFPIPPALAGAARLIDGRPGDSSTYYVVTDTDFGLLRDNNCTASDILAQSQSTFGFVPQAMEPSVDGRYVWLSAHSATNEWLIQMNGDPAQSPSVSILANYPAGTGSGPLAASPDGQRLYLILENQNAVSVFNSSGGFPSEMDTDLDYSNGVTPHALPAGCIPRAIGSRMGTLGRQAWVLCEGLSQVVILQ